jgi:glycosyltransferase involved in cell wall biosynthesis
MRILMLVSMVPQADGVGAIPKLLHAQVSGLRRDHRLTLLGGYGELPGQAEAAAALARSGLDAHFVDRRPSRSPLRRWRVRASLAATWATRPWPWRAVPMRSLQPALDRLLAEKSFDVVALEEDLMSILRLPPGLPKVLTEHEAAQAPAEGWRAPRLRERPERALRVRDWQRWDEFRIAAWRSADLVQVYSRSDAEAIGRRAPELAERVRVNPFGIEPPPPADPAEESAHSVLFSGTFTHLPNRDAALWLAREIMPAVRAEVPEARLELVGSAPPHEVQELVGPGVELFADVPSVRPHLERAAVVLAPVRNGGGMRMKVLEAMATGKAIVTTRLGAEGLTGLGEEPPLVIADDPWAIAAATAELLREPERRRRLAAQAREFALRHHSPESWSERLEAVYEEARAGRTRLPV